MAKGELGGGRPSCCLRPRMRGFRNGATWFQKGGVLEATFLLADMTRRSLDVIGRSPGADASVAQTQEGNGREKGRGIRSPSSIPKIVEE